MILGAENPLANEPCRVDRSNEAQKRYTDTVQSYTVSYAIIWWIVSAKAKMGVWEKISAVYFKHKGKQLMKMAEEAAPSNSAGLREYCELITSKHYTSTTGLACPPNHVDLMMLLE